MLNYQLTQIYPLIVEIINGEKREIINALLIGGFIATVAGIGGVVATGVLTD